MTTQKSPQNPVLISSHYLAISNNIPLWFLCDYTRSDCEGPYIRALRSLHLRPEIETGLGLGFVFFFKV